MSNASQSKSVLVVEDDPFYLNIYRAKFVKEGFDVRLAKNGDEALEAARNRRPDLMLLDLIMPGKDGFETLADFQKDPALAGIRIVVLSNLSQEEDMERAKGLGATEYVVKANISLQEIVEKVKRYLN